MNPPDFKQSRRASPARISPEKSRLPPHSIEAEQGVLGTIMLDPPLVLSEIMSKGSDIAERFYHLPHRCIFEHIQSMQGAGKAVDLITLSERLRDSGELDAVGGVAYLVSLQDAVPSAANWSYYFDIVTEKYLLRRMLRAASELTEDIHERAGTVDEIVASFHQRALAIGSFKGGGFVDAKAFVQGAIESLEARHKAAVEGKAVGVPTGIRPIDRLLGGLVGSDVVVIAARPSCGKTSMLWQICEHAATVEGKAVGIFSLEMSAKSLGARALCSMARVSPSHGVLTNRDMAALGAASVKLSASKIYIDEQAGISVGTLRARARQMRQLHKIDLIAIDYLQLIHATGKHQSREQEVASVSQQIKEMAKELDVPVVLLVQFNRDADKRGTKPRLTDLRESGAIEQDADIVIGLYKPDPDAESADACPTNALVMKHRNGPTGDIPLVFLKRTTRFEEKEFETQ